MPAWMPPSGRHGSAHVVGSTLATSGTLACRRPICMGSMLLSTVPRYFPTNCPTVVASPSDAHGRNDGGVGDQRVALEREALLVRADRDVVRDAVDIVQAVEGRARAAHADELARFQDAAVAQHVQRSTAAYDVRGGGRARHALHEGLAGRQ